MTVSVLLCLTPTRMNNVKANTVVGRSYRCLITCSSKLIGFSGGKDKKTGEKNSSAEYKKEQLKLLCMISVRNLLQIVGHLLF